MIGDLIENARRLRAAAILRKLSVEQQKGFCPTGQGGGVDPSCGSGGGSIGWIIHRDPTTVFFRGMSQEGFERFRNKQTIESEHTSNVFTTDRETAEYYASTRVHEEQGVVIKFQVHPEDIKNELVQQDAISTSDYKISGTIRTINWSVVEEVVDGR